MKKTNFIHNIFIYFLLYLGNIFIAGSIILLSPLIRKMSFYNLMIKAWAKWGTWMVPGKLTIKGLENIVPDKPYIVIANHESSVDVFYLLGRLPINMRMVAKEELRKSPFIGGAMDRSGFIFVDTKNKGRSIGHLNKKFEILKKEKLSLMVFPEGSRFKDTLLGKFRTGAFVMAIQNDMPILPIVMKGVREMLPPESKSFHRSDIEIDILPEINTSEYTYEERNELLDKCHHLMHDHLTSMYERENK
jgi:1-acyl-sn-glycerol-3-phosphate acyltransferase